MNIKKTALLAALGVLAVFNAQAQVELTVTGSTAFRSISFNRFPVLFDSGSLQSNVTNANIRTYTGTMSNAVPALGNTTVTIRSAFSGSAAGMIAVRNGTPLSALNVDGTSVNKTPDVAFSDVFPGSANPPIPESAFAKRDVVGVTPFVWVKNNSLVGVDNLTREQAVLLMTASGTGLMPANFLGGALTNNVYAVGRDSGSGSRITVEKDIGFVGNPTLWATNGAGVLITTNGYSSASLVASTVKGTSYTIGYMSLGDFITINTSATALSYNGVPFSATNVQNGKYAMWGYEHLVSRNGMSANQQLVRNALVSAITNQTYQTSDPSYAGLFVDIANMQVERGADGGTITSLQF